MNKRVIAIILKVSLVAFALAIVFRCDEAQACNTQLGFPDSCNQYCDGELVRGPGAGPIKAPTCEEIRAAKAAAQQSKEQPIQLIKDTAASICNTVLAGARGQKSDFQVQGDVKVQLRGLLGKFADAGVSGAGQLNREEFEGLSREATAIALEGDRGCRERIFHKMFEKLM